MKKEKKIVGYISIGQTKSNSHFVCPIDTPDDKVEELAKQEAFDFINWGWWEEEI